MIEQPFGEWLPDQGDYRNPGLVEAKNVIATPRGYSPFRGRSDVFTLPTINNPRVARYVRAGGLSQMVIGTSAEVLLVRNNGTPLTSYNISVVDQVSLTGGTSIIGVAVFDSNIIAAASPTGSYFEIPVSSGAVTWSALPNPPPVGAHSIAKIGQFLAVAGTDGNFYWSGFNDYGDFRPSQTTQAGVASANDTGLGKFVGVYGGRTPVIFQTGAVSRLSYVGPPTVWATQEISTDIGCVAPMSIVGYEDRVYFLSSRGPAVTDGASVVLLGRGKSEKWLRDKLAANDASRHLFQATGTLDEARKLIIWSFRANETFIGPSEFHLVYSADTDSLTYLEDETLPYCFSGFGAVGYGASASPGALFGVYEDSGSDKLGVFTGATLAAEMTMGHQPLTPGARVEIDAAEPVYTGTGATVAFSTKQTINGAATVTPYSGQNAIGQVNHRASGRVAATSVRFPSSADWDEFKGVIVNPNNAGSR